MREEIARLTRSNCQKLLEKSSLTSYISAFCSGNPAVVAHRIDPCPEGEPMPAPTALDSFLSDLKKSGLVESVQLDQYLSKLTDDQQAAPLPLAKLLVRDGLLTLFQARLLLRGKNRGFVIGGKYKVLDRLGEGGMGAVYLVEHLRLHCLFAMKVLPRDRIKDPAALGRFYREARATAAVNHPNIVRTHDVDRDGDLHFIVMEYVDGCDLQRVVDAHGPVDVSVAAHLISQAANGLQQIHDAGWVHRDVKPSNLLVARDGVVKILDLGVARLFAEARSVTQEYSSGNVALGTADYVAPEQVTDSSVVDIRSDIYSLGVVLYFLLSARTPFGEGSAALKVMRANLREPDPIDATRGDLPRELVAILKRMLAKDPAARFQSPSEVIEALAPWTQEPFLPPANWLPAPNAAEVVLAARTGGLKAAGTTPHPRYEPTHPARPGVAAPRLSRTAVARPLQQQQTEPQIQPSEPPSWRRKWAQVRQSPIRFVALAIAIAVVLVGVGWAALGRRLARDSTPEKPVGDPEFWKMIVSPPSGNPPIYVTGGNDALAKGVQYAKPGDWVVVTGGKVEGTLEIDGTKFGREVTIIGAAGGVNGPAGTAVWRAPASARPNTPLIRVTGVERLVIENLTLDGEARLDHLIEVRGRCPGLKLVNLRLRGFQKRAVVLEGCGGDPDEEVVLDRLRVNVDPAISQAEAAVVFRPGPAGTHSATNQHIQMIDCRFDGGLASAVALEGPSVYLSFQRNRFYRCRDAFRLADTPAADRVRMTVEGNTMAEVDQVVNLERIPPSDEVNRLLFKNNLFVRAPALVRVRRGGGSDELA